MSFSDQDWTCATKDTSVCVVDQEGAILIECSVPTDPDILAKALRPFRRTGTFREQ